MVGKRDADSSNSRELIDPGQVGVMRLAEIARMWKKSGEIDYVDTVSSSEGTLPPPRVIRRRLPPEKITEIVRRYREGINTPQLCEEYSLSKTAMLALLREEGVQLRRKSPSPEKIDEAAELYRSGLSLALVAQQVNVPRTTIQSALIRAGVVLRPRGSRC